MAGYLAQKNCMYKKINSLYQIIYCIDLFFLSALFLNKIISNAISLYFLIERKHEITQ
jgi:hypothetical protein